MPRESCPTLRLLPKSKKWHRLRPGRVRQYCSGKCLFTESTHPLPLPPVTPTAPKLLELTPVMSAGDEVAMETTSQGSSNAGSGIMSPPKEAPPTTPSQATPTSSQTSDSTEPPKQPTEGLVFSD